MKLSDVQKNRDRARRKRKMLRQFKSVGREWVQLNEPHRLLFEFFEIVSDGFVLSNNRAARKYGGEWVLVTKYGDDREIMTDSDFINCLLKAMEHAIANYPDAVQKYRDKMAETKTTPRQRMNHRRTADELKKRQKDVNDE